MRSHLGSAGRGKTLVLRGFHRGDNEFLPLPGHLSLQTGGRRAEGEQALGPCLRALCTVAFAAESGCLVWY